MTGDLVSVIVPVFNGEKTLERCIDSIVNQTYVSIEILIIDDGSCDRSALIADEYARNDERVRAYHKDNGGISSARNLGIDNAVGDWIAFVDSDDWIEPDTIKIAISHCSAEVDICIFGRSIDRPGNSVKQRPTVDKETIDGREALKRLIVDGTIGHTAWDKIYRRELFLDLRFPDGFNYEEIRTAYRFLGKAKSIVLIPDVCYHYVQYANSVSNTSSAKNRLDHWSACYELFRVFGSDAEFIAACIRRCSYSIMKAWGSLWKAQKGEFEAESARVIEIHEFAKKYWREAVTDAKCKFHGKIGIILAAIGGRWSMGIAYMFVRMYQLLVPVDVYDKNAQSYK